MKRNRGFLATIAVAIVFANFSVHAFNPFRKLSIEKRQEAFLKQLQEFSESVERVSKSTQNMTKVVHIMAQANSAAKMQQLIRACLASLLLSRQYMNEKDLQQACEMAQDMHDKFDKAVKQNDKNDYHGFASTLDYFYACIISQCADSENMRRATNADQGCLPFSRSYKGKEYYEKACKSDFWSRLTPEQIKNVQDGTNQVLSK